MKSSSESKPLPGARITRGEQLPYYAYVTAFLRTSLFLDTSYGTFSRENGISGKAVLKINWSLKTPWHESMEVAHSRLWAPASTISLWGYLSFLNLAIARPYWYFLYSVPRSVALPTIRYVPLTWRGFIFICDIRRDLIQYNDWFDFFTICGFYLLAIPCFP